MHALVRFAHIAAGNTFTTAELYPYVLAALQMSSAQYSLASLRYDLGKSRAKALVEKLPKSRRYRLCPQGYSIRLVFLKLFERVYSPLTAGCFNLTGLTPNSGIQTNPIGSTLSKVCRRSRRASSCFWPLRLPKQLEQNSRYATHNGVRFFADCAAKKGLL
jgi:hypothetical protein